MSEFDDLPKIRNHLFDQSEALWWRSFYLMLAMQALLLIAVWISHPALEWIVGFFALMVPLIVTWMRYHAGGYASKGDKARRLILYADGLGREIPPAELSEVRSWTIGSQLGEAPFESPYYASTLNSGPARLADITAESAFFTSKVAGIVENKLKAVIGVVTLFLLGIIYFGVEKSVAADPAIGKFVLMIASFLLGGEILLLMVRYGSLKQNAQAAFEKCGSLRTNPDLELYEAMQAVEDYHVALIGSPPVPFKYYLKYKDELNDIWKNSHAL